VKTIEEIKIMMKENVLNLSDKMYNISAVMQDYCQQKVTCEELQNLKPIVEYLHNLSDNLNQKLESMEI